MKKHLNVDFNDITTQNDLGYNIWESIGWFQTLQKINMYYVWLKYGFYKYCFFSEWTSDQWYIFWPFLSSLLGEFGVALLLHLPKSDEKNG